MRTGSKPCTPTQPALEVSFRTENRPQPALESHFGQGINCHSLPWRSICGHGQTTHPCPGCIGGLHVGRGQTTTSPHIVFGFTCGSGADHTPLPTLYWRPALEGDMQAGIRPDRTLILGGDLRQLVPRGDIHTSRLCHAKNQLCIQRTRLTNLSKTQQIHHNYGIQICHCVSA